MTQPIVRSTPNAILWVWNKINVHKSESILQNPDIKSWISFDYYFNGQLILSWFFDNDCKCLFSKFIGMFSRFRSNSPILLIRNESVVLVVKTRLLARLVQKEDNFWFNNLICKMCMKNPLISHLHHLKFAPFKYVWRLEQFDAQLNRLQVVLRLKFLKIVTILVSYLL